MIKIQFLIYLIGLEPPILDEIWELEGVHKLHESEKGKDLFKTCLFEQFIYFFHYDFQKILMNQEVFSKEI